MFSDLFWTLYWIDVLSGLPEAAAVGFLISVLVGAAVSLIRDSTPYTAVLSVKNIAIGFFASFAVCSMFAFIPSKQTMYIMLGVKTTENVVKSPLGKKLQQIVDAEVEGYLQKLTKEKK